MSHRFSAVSGTLARALVAGAGLVALGACAPAPPTLAPTPQATPQATPQVTPVRTVTERAGEVERVSTQRVISIEELTTGPLAAPTVRMLAPTVSRTGLARSAPAARTTVPQVGAPGTTLWRGTYEGGTYSRRGALALLLRTSPAGIEGGVVAWRVAPATADAFGRNAGRADVTSLIRVPVVSATRDGERVVLHLDDFYDAGCNCTARATFRGLVRGDTLTGRFTVDGAATVVGEGRGRWRAVRVQAEP